MSKLIKNNDNLSKIEYSYHPIQLFINRYDNKNTKDGYENVILSFYTTIGAKKYEDIKQIEKNIIIGVTPITILSYCDLLKKSGYAKTTIYYKLTVIREFYNFLIILNLYNENNPVEILKNKIKISDDDINSSDAFSIEEIRAIINISNDKYSTLYKMATITGVRISALLSLDLNSFTIHNNEHITVTGFDKGNKKFINIITKDLYDNCIRVNRMNYKSNKIFDMTRQAVSLNLKKAIKELGINTTNRKLSFHSFKKSSVTIAGDLSGGDIRKMLEVSHHHNADLTLKIYDKSKNNLNNNIGLKIAEAIN